MPREIREITRAEVKAATERALNQIKRNIPVFAGKCQNHTSVGGFYPPCDNAQWTCGFWPGQIWLAYTLTGEDEFLHAGAAYTDMFIGRERDGVELDHHDMGFLYTPTCVASHRRTGNENSLVAAVNAARRLVGRFHEKGEFIQAWGALGEKGNYRYIIDCLMNLPLLYWAYEQTKEEEFLRVARRHTNTCLKYSFRPDGSTYHTVFMNPDDGTFVRGETCQGYSDESFWARGQAWAIYGAALGWRYGGRADCADAFRAALSFYLSKLPEDLVPYWDMIFTDGGEPRDSSSAAIVACGLLEASNLMNGADGFSYARLAKQIIKSLADDYGVRDPRTSNGLLLHATYSKKSPYNTCTEEGVDECAGWGDYFYLEALARLRGDSVPYPFW